MYSIRRSQPSIAVLTLKDIEAIGRVNGFSTYKDILVLWDEDFDTRVLDLIDELMVKEPAAAMLVAVHEHEGFVDFFWRQHPGGIPNQLRNGVYIEDGDYWLAKHHFMEEVA